MSDLDFAAIVGLSAALAAGAWARGTEWSASKLGVTSAWLGRLTAARKTWIVVLGLLLPAAYIAASVSRTGAVDRSVVVWALVAIVLAMVVFSAALSVCVLQLRKDAVQQGIAIPLWVDAKLVEPQPYEQVTFSYRRVMKAAGVVFVLWLLACAVGIWWLARGL